MHISNGVFMYFTNWYNYNIIMHDDCDFYDIASFIRGYHAYKELWDPNVGQVLKLRKEPDNSHDRRAVAVVNAADTVMGHVPYSLSPYTLTLLGKGIQQRHRPRYRGEKLIVALGTDSRFRAFIVCTVRRHIWSA